MKSNKDFLTTNQVAKRFNIKRSDDISDLIRKGEFPNAKKVGKSWRIPLEDIIAYESYIDSFKNTLDIKQVAKRLGFEEARMHGLIKRLALPNAFMSKGKWWIPESDVEAIENERLSTYSVHQACNKLEFDSTAKVRYLIRIGIFDNAYKDFSGQWRIPSKDFKKILDNNNNNNSNFVNNKKAAKLLGYQSTSPVLHLIKKQFFPNAFKRSGHWYIPIEEINKHIKVLTDSLTTLETMKRLEYTNPYSVIQLIEKSILPNAFKYNSKWRIPLTDINHLEESRLKTLNTTQTATRLGNSPVLITQFIKEGKFPNAYKDVLYKWRIPLSDIESYEKENNTENHICIKDASMILGYKSNSTMLAFLRDGRFPNSKKSKGKWWIHKNDVNALKNQLEKKKYLKKKR